MGRTETENIGEGMTREEYSELWFGFDREELLGGNDGACHLWDELLLVRAEIFRWEKASCRERKDFRDSEGRIFSEESYSPSSGCSIEIIA